MCENRIRDGDGPRVIFNLWWNSPGIQLEYRYVVRLFKYSNDPDLAVEPSSRID